MTLEFSVASKTDYVLSLRHWVMMTDDCDEPQQLQIFLLQFLLQLAN